MAQQQGEDEGERDGLEVVAHAAEDRPRLAWVRGVERVRADDHGPRALGERMIRGLGEGHGPRKVPRLRGGAARGAFVPGRRRGA